MIRRPTRSTRTDTPVPDTTLFRSAGAATGQEVAELMDSPSADLVGTLVGAQAGGSAFNAATAPARGISSIRDRYGKDKAMMDPTTGTSPRHLAVREVAREIGRAHV